MRRAVARRVGYVTSLFTDLGFEAGEARRRELLAYSAYLGHVEIVVRMDDTLPPRGPDLDAYLDTARKALSAVPPH